MVRKISGKFAPLPIKHLKQNNATVDNPQDIANVLGSTLEYNSSSNHYTAAFQRYKNQQEKNLLNSNQIIQKSTIHYSLMMN
jgi:hypothetical protein